GDGGSIILIHRADALLEILRALEPRAGSFQVRPIQPFAGAPAKRIVVRAAKGGRAPLRLLAPLLLHPRGRQGHTSEAEAILRGRARLKWAEES
ncbi:MAG: methyltransferase, partial [Caulobacteraceae bacterium]